MSRLSGRLSQVGALVLAVVAAAVAYSVYDPDSTPSNTDAGAPIAGLTADSADTLPGPGPERQEKTRRVPETRIGRTAGASRTEAARPAWPATAPQPQLRDPVFRTVAASLTGASAPLPHVSAPLPSDPLRTVLPLTKDDHGRQRARDHDRGPWRPGPFDNRTLDRELHRLIGDKPPPRVPREPAEDFPTELPPELINGPGVPTPRRAPEPPNIPQPAVPPSPTPVAPPPSATPATPAADAPSESTPDETPPPPPAEATPAPADPDDQTGNADDEDAGIDDQSGEAEDESPVAPGGSEGADDGVAGDGDDAVPPPAPSAPPVAEVEEDTITAAPAPTAPAAPVEPEPADAGLPATGAAAPAPAAPADQVESQPVDAGSP